MGVFLCGANLALVVVGYVIFYNIISCSWGLEKVQQKWWRLAIGKVG